jgi:hypothetical protein
VLQNNRREHFRISYPPNGRARFVYGNSISEVIECSERGVRFRTCGIKPEDGTEISGRIAMRHGLEVRVCGTVIWADDQAVALNLDSVPIPFLAIMREQLYLRNHAK